MRERYRTIVADPPWDIAWKGGESVRMGGGKMRPSKVNRVATDGHRNACSMLYATCWRAARALGYRKLVTYTLASEGGVSLRAAGWRVVGGAEGVAARQPARPTRTRVRTHGSGGRRRDRTKKCSNASYCTRFGCQL